MISKSFILFSYTALLAAQVTRADLQESFGFPKTLSRSPLQQLLKIGTDSEMRVIYDKTENACRIEMPLSRTSRDEVLRTLSKAVPEAVRGAKWNEVEMMVGLGGLRTTYYERVITTEDVVTSGSDPRTTRIVLVFKKKSCGWTADSNPFDAPRSASKSSKGS